MRGLFRRKKGLGVSSKKTFPSGIKTLHEPDNAAIDIVFVHGLTGDRERTWTAHGTSEPWLKTLLPSKIPNARILTFGYDAYVASWHAVVSQSRIEHHAGNLLSSLATCRTDDPRPIIFVCHSLGGLVCKDALFKASQHQQQHIHNIFCSTRGVAFLGTPHYGAGALAQWTSRLAKSIGLVTPANDEIVKVLRNDSSRLMENHARFHTLVNTLTPGHSIEITCFYEELPLPVVGLVVPQESAILPEYISIGIHNNHKDMTKFTSMDDPGFVAVCGELRRWIKQLHENPSTPFTSKGKEKGEHVRLADDGLGSSHFLVPYTSNPGFVGRQKILDQLKDLLDCGESGPDRTWQPRASLCGIGGVGKTQVALAYIYWLHDSYPNLSVFWVHASNSDRFRQAYAQIAEECHIPGCDTPTTNTLLLVKQWLETRDHGRWLMVVDNADDLDLFFGLPAAIPDAPTTSGANGYAKYIPDCAHGSLLFTTINKQVGLRLAKGKQPLEVGPMDDDDAASLFRASIDQDINAEELSILSERLDRLPLALIQAAAFMQENVITISEYLQLLDSGDQAQADLLSEDFETIGRDAEKPRAVAKTWMLALAQVQQRDALAIELLAVMSLVDRQAIPVELLTEYQKQQRQSETPHDKFQLTKALGFLKAFSLVAEKQLGSFEVHRLVQLVTRTWLDQTNRLQHFGEQTLQALSAIFPVGCFEHWAICNAYLPHGLAVLQLAATGSREKKVAKAELLHRVGHIHILNGHFKDAKIRFREAWDIRRVVLGECHTDTLDSMESLAEIILKQDGPAEAEPLQVQVLEMRKKEQGENDPSTLRSVGNLVTVFQRQRQWEKAEALEVQALEKMKRVFGEDHFCTLLSIQSLSDTFLGQGRVKEAEDLGVQVLEKMKRVGGEDHPFTIDCLLSLLIILKAQGRWKEAEALGVQMLEKMNRVYGENHPWTLTRKAYLEAAALRHRSFDKTQCPGTITDVGARTSKDE